MRNEKWAMSNEIWEMSYEIWEMRNELWDMKIAWSEDSKNLPIIDIPEVQRPNVKKFPFKWNLFKTSPDADPTHPNHKKSHFTKISLSFDQPVQCSVASSFPSQIGLEDSWSVTSLSRAIKMFQTLLIGIWTGRSVGTYIFLISPVCGGNHLC